MIREFIKQHFSQLRMRFIFNPNFAETNNAYSLLLARRFLENKDGNVNSGLLLLDSDILFSSQLLPHFLNKSSGRHVAIRVLGKHNEEEISVKTDGDGIITRIGKEISLGNAFGESIGIEAFSTEIVVRLFDILEKRIRNSIGRTEFYEASFQEMIDSGVKLKAIDVSAFPAIEIDTMEDFQIAERMSVD
jgi:choline kinase